MNERIVTTVLIAWAAGCGGTETNNPIDPSTPLVHFEGSACKKDAPDGGGGLGESRQALMTASDYDGLQCIAWERGAAGKLSLQLINFRGGCSVTWDGQAEVNADGRVDLRLINPSCQVAGCGWCIYDFRFELSGVEPRPDLPLRIGFVDCPSDPTVRWDYDTSLHLGEAKEGITCRYGDRSALTWLGQRGKKNLLCGGSGGPCPATCADDLACTPVDGVDDGRCLAPCTADTDCFPSSVMTCQQGVCRLASAW
jgi:hypothetical protein